MQGVAGLTAVWPLMLALLLLLSVCLCIPTVHCCPPRYLLCYYIACPAPPCPCQVDYTGFSTINTQRFGQKFVGKVANPHDIILWQKAAKRKEKVRLSKPLRAKS